MQITFYKTKTPTNYADKINEYGALSEGVFCEEVF